MKFLANLSINLKLNILVATAASVAMTLCCGAFLFNDIRSLREAKVRQLSALAEVLGANSAAALIFDDKQTAEELLQSLKLQPTVEFASLYNDQGELFATYGNVNDVDFVTRAPARDGPQFTEEKHLSVTHEIVENGEFLGTIIVHDTLFDLQALIIRDALLAIGMLGISLCISILLAGRLQRFVTTPILELAKATEEVSAEKDYAIRVEKMGNDEIGTLCEGFNKMLDQIQQAQGKLQSAHDELEDRVQQRTGELEKARREAVAASKTKSEFLANMSHEIRTPLTGILGFTEMLLNGGDKDDKERRNDMLDTVHRSGTHLLALINDILDLSKIEAGHLQIEQIPCSPFVIVEGIASALRPKALEKDGLSLEVEYSDTLPALVNELRQQQGLTPFDQGGIPEKIFSDPARLRQVLMNLVGNAIKFTDRGEVIIHLELFQRDNQLWIQFEVRDTGIGIPADKLKRVFDAFVQADGTVTRKFGGTGLGLAISRRLAEGLGGELIAQSQLDKGSTFILDIPIGPLQDVPLRSDWGKQDPANYSSSKNGWDWSKQLQGRVLLVEDGQTNRKLIKLILQRVGIEVVAAENGLEGIELASNGLYDVILMDMQMPVMDGYTAAVTLREQGFDVPIIALTAHAMKGDEQKCIEAGCTGYLPKPIDAGNLLQTVAEFLKTKETPSLPSMPESAESPRKESKSPLHSSLPVEDPDYREIAVEFIEHLHAKMLQMKSALSGNDVSTLTQFAHWLKGAGGTAGFDIITQPARRLEELTLEKRWDEIQTVFDELENIAQRLVVPSEPNVIENEYVNR